MAEFITTDNGVSIPVSFRDQMLRKLKGVPLSVYLCIKFYPEDELNDGLPLNLICDRTGYSKVAVIQALKMLDKIGLIDRWQLTYGGDRDPSNYVSPLRRKVYSKTGGHCAYCGISLELYGRWHIDHRTPKSLGGSDNLSNLMPSCPRCNNLKSAMGVFAFLDEATRLYKEDRASLHPSLALWLSDHERFYFHEL